jgi:cytochrome P450 PksS
MMLVAGQVTTTDQLNNNLFQMLSTGSDRRLREDLSLLPSALEEFNRLDPGVTFLFRTVKSPVSLGGIPLKPEDVVFVSNHAVNRDPAQFTDPDACVFARARNPHFAFGHGPHFCLGARLARLQMESCFRAMLALKELRFDPKNPPVRNHYALSFSGFSSLPLTVN